ncbi:hypothetical protein BLNAU_20436 [Blattamonas nauphoetae]|uniref:Uncharacterized protein n=1 Tax=Blattamonas nauphoetae TaxID=2049346 RepID=A0ABQ9X120_9EUKA|nr:hypothetical protein BLNAU_20436 [Blattamonas nauphoetae]
MTDLRTYPTSNSVHTLDIEVIGAPSITKELTLYPTSTLLFNIEVPFPPTVTGASFDFDTKINTTCIVTLTGSHLNLQGHYLVTLDHGPTLTFNFNQTIKAQTSVLLIGLSETLQFSETYEVTSIKKVGDPNDIVRLPAPVSFTTLAKPTTLTVYVDEKTGNSEPTCGDSTKPCTTVDVAWSLATTLKIPQVKMLIIKSTLQSKPLTIPSGGFLVVTKDEFGSPSLRLESTATMGGMEGMIVAKDASLEMGNSFSLISEPILHYVPSEKSTPAPIDSLDGRWSLNPNTAGPENEQAESEHEDLQEEDDVKAEEVEYFEEDQVEDEEIEAEVKTRSFGART